MKPNKTLDELLDTIREKVVASYKLLQTQNATGLSTLAAELASINFSISYYVADYEFESGSMKAEYKRQLAQTFMSERKAGATEKNADATARLKWAEMEDEQLAAAKAYRLAKSTHSDIENLLDIMRSRIGILRKELNERGLSG